MKQEGKKDGVHVKAEKEEECDKFSEDRYSTEYVLSQTQETSAIAENTVAELVFGVLSYAGKFESDFQGDVLKNVLILQKWLAF